VPYRRRSGRESIVALSGTRVGRGVVGGDWATGVSREEITVYGLQGRRPRSGTRADLGTKFDQRGNIKLHH
jgi:hypothetical protein